MPHDPAPTTAVLYRALWTHARGARAVLAAAMALLAGAQALRLSIPWLAARAIDRLQTAGLEARPQAAGWAAAIVGVTLAGWALHGPGRILERNVAIRVRRSLWQALMTALLARPLAWHEARHGGDTAHRVQRSTEALHDFAQGQFVWLQNAIGLLGPLLALALIDPWLGAAAACGYGGLLGTVAGLDRRMVRLAGEENAAQRRLQSALLDTLGAIASVHALRLHRAVQARLDARLAASFVPLRRSIALNEAKWCVVDLTSVVLWAGLVALQGWRSAEPGAPLLIGGLFMVHQYAQQAGGVVTALAAQAQGFARQRADYAQGLSLLADAPERSTAPAWPIAAAADRWQRIDLHDLRFRHPADRHPDRPPPLDGLALTLRRGRRIALLGASGAGKSSLLRVLAGLYPPQAGGATVDGVATSPLAATATRATLIPQEAELFEATLRENVALDADESPQAIEAAIAMAALDDWTATLPDGQDHPVAEQGANLSGGQRQRLALARGLLAARGSSLLLLDESTSQLDAATEARVLDRLFAGRPDACIVASVHRTALLPRFDEAWRLANGRLEPVSTERNPPPPPPAVSS